MVLDELDIPKKTLVNLKKAHITKINELVSIFPQRYLDYRQILPLEAAAEKDCAVSGYLVDFEKSEADGICVITAKVEEKETGNIVNIYWYDQSWQLPDIIKFLKKEVVVCGFVKKHPIYGYSISNPYSYHLLANYKRMIYPVYSEIPNVMQHELAKAIDIGINAIEESLPQEIIDNEELIGYQNALVAIHHPESTGNENVHEIIAEASRRIIFEDVLRYVLMLNNKNANDYQTSIKIANTNILAELEKSLPYALSREQKNIIYEMKKKMVTGMRCNMLIQGNVGCGKTTIALMAILMMTANAYQSIVMLPQKKLYQSDAIFSFLKRYGLECYKLIPDMEQAEKDSVLSKIRDGEAKVVICTPEFVLSDMYPPKLGLIVTLEEYTFPTNQRMEIERWANKGVHIVSLSTTKIQRMVADMLYGRNKDLKTIEGLPGKRCPVQTAINNSDERIYDFVGKQINNGNQVYVVCPPMRDEAISRWTTETVDEITERYRKRYEIYGAKVEKITKKTKSAEQKNIIKNFKDGLVKILITDCLLECDIGTPMVNCVVVTNAEQFELTELHEIRETVGKISDKSYCILKTTKRKEPKLLKMAETYNADELILFLVATDDFSKLLQIRQHDPNYMMRIAIKYPYLFNVAKKYTEYLSKTDA